MINNLLMNLNIDKIHTLIIDKLGFIYVLFSIFLIISFFYFIISRFGEVRLGDEKNKINDLLWGSLIFTSTMAADLFYWALIEWAYYYFNNPNLSPMEKYKLAISYPLFHWGPIPWLVYLIPAVIYAYFMYVEKIKLNKPSDSIDFFIFNSHYKKNIIKQTINIFSIISLILGVSTMFTISLPLIGNIISDFVNIENQTNLNMLILFIIFIIYTIASLKNLRGISFLSKISTYIFLVLIILILISGPSIFIIESGISGLGIMLDNFIKYTTNMSELRIFDSKNTIMQDWTIFYWAYWISWSISTPLFIAKISEGRKVKDLLIKGLLYGLAGTYMSLIVLGNYGIFQFINGSIPNLSNKNFNPNHIILDILKTFKNYKLISISIILVMIAFYSTTLDAMVEVLNNFSKNKNNSSKIMWSLSLITLPMIFLYKEKELKTLKLIPVIGSLPILILEFLMILNFIKYLNEGD